MRIEDLKTGFFGYRKDSVYRLIASMEENFSAALVEKDAQYAKALQEAQMKIGQLEDELRTLREEHTASRKDQDMISSALLAAQAYARKLRDESDAQERLLRGRIQDEADRLRGQMEEYAGQIGRLRGVIRTLLQELDERCSEVEEQVGDVAARAPETEVNLSLFTKKNEKED